MVIFCTCFLAKDNYDSTLGTNKGSHKFFVIYICIHQCFWLLFWLFWPLFHELYQNVVLLEDWMTIELLCLLLSAWSSLDPVDSPNLSILYINSQNYLYRLKTLLQEYLFDLPFSKTHLKIVSIHLEWHL